MLIFYHFIPKFILFYLETFTSFIFHLFVLFIFNLLYIFCIFHKGPNIFLDILLLRIWNILKDLLKKTYSIKDLKYDHVFCQLFGILVALLGYGHFLATDCLYLIELMFKLFWIDQMLFYIVYLLNLFTY